MKNMGNKKQLIGFVALAMVCVLIGTGVGMVTANRATAQEGGTKLEGVVESPFTKAVEAVHDSVVGVSNYKTYQTSNYGYYGYGRSRGNSEGTTKEVEAGSGSGTVISDQGHVLTNYHVIEGASRVTVTANDKEYEAQVIAYDVDLDIAVIKAEGLNLPYVSLGDSDSLRIGDWAICIGNPLSDEFVGTTTAGIVSGLNRQISTGASTDKYGRKTTTSNTMIQVDASINSGNSGGGMFNVLGELVGIPTIKYSSSGYFSSASIEGIGMCIPINSAKPLIEKVLSGEIKAEDNKSATTEQTNVNNDLIGKPRMGITYSPINGASYNGILPSGAYISVVEEGTPAKEGGLLPGDIIVEVDGTIVSASCQELKDAVAAKKAGDTVELTVYRAEGLYEVMERVMAGESVAYDEVPSGDYTDVNVVLKVIDQVSQ